MREAIYRKLAQRLDAIPNGFPATESGVELRLLAWMYTRQEAELAAVMRVQREPADDIAERAGVAPAIAYRLLEHMADKGLVSASGSGRRGMYGLCPFTVGAYEAQLDRMDAELAELYEQYSQETRGGLMHDAPPLHRVIPVGEAISHELEVYPYEQASVLVERAKAWAVRDCICRVQQRLIGKGCGRAIETCLVFAAVPDAFHRNRKVRAISKEEALWILRRAQEAGLVHTLGNYRHGNSYICNCCTCCCRTLRSLTEFAQPAAVARSRFCAVPTPDLCTGCGNCLDRCPFAALSLTGETLSVDRSRCLGCGLCVTACPAGALRLEPRPKGEISLPPMNSEEWRNQRVRARRRSRVG